MFKIWAWVYCLSTNLLYILTSNWVLGTPKRWSKYDFYIFCAKKLKKNAKSKEFAAKLSKTTGFISLHQNTGQGWKNLFFSGNKTFNQDFGANLKTLFLLNYAANYSFVFFSYTAQKMLKWRFQPVFVVRSTQTLFEIYNTYSKNASREKEQLLLCFKWRKSIIINIKLKYKEVNVLINPRIT